jgi:hypothetical protein
MVDERSRRFSVGERSEWEESSSKDSCCRKRGCVEQIMRWTRDCSVRVYVRNLDSDTGVITTRREGDDVFSVLDMSCDREMWC